MLAASLRRQRFAPGACADPAACRFI